MKVKFIGMILLASFTGIVLNPEFLAASDSVKISDLDQSNVTETIIEEKPAEVAAKPVERPVKKSVEKVVATPTAPKAGVAQKKAETPKKVQNQVKFSWGAMELAFSNTAATDAGNKAVKVGKMIYGHDYTSFGKITSLKIGDTFSVTINGATKNYRVKANPVDGTKGVLVKVVNAKRGEVYHEKLGNFYTSALEKGWTHDLVLLTCYQGGRYIVVADEI